MTGEGFRLFRPLLTLRITLALFGAICAPASILLFASGRAGAGLLVAVPAVIGLAVERIRISASGDGIELRSLWGRKAAAWGEVVRLDITRSGFTLRTRGGDIDGGWLSRTARAELIRLIVDRGKLLPSVEELPYGVLARYLPRARPLPFLPHNLRRERGETPPGE